MQDRVQKKREKGSRFSGRVTFRETALKRRQVRIRIRTNDDASVEFKPARGGLAKKKKRGGIILQVIEKVRIRNNNCDCSILDCARVMFHLRPKDIVFQQPMLAFFFKLSAITRAKFAELVWYFGEIEFC